jgi:hypothetical protein
MSLKGAKPPIPIIRPPNLSGYLDQYMTADEKMVALGQRFEEIAQLIIQQTGGSMTVRGRTQEIPFQQVLAVGQAVRLAQPMPFPGKIVKILRHWPAGCNALVDVAVGVGNKRILPESGWVALNDATPVYDNLSIPAAQGEPLWVEMANGDAINAHTITVTITIEEVIT